MDLNDYFDPVELEKPQMAFISDDVAFGHHLTVNTANHPVDEISDYQIAILGVGEDRGSGKNSSGRPPDLIRSKLYQLCRNNGRQRIIDLGNLKKTSSVMDTYYGLRDVMIELINNQVVTIVIGGTQDISYGVYMAFEKVFRAVSMISIDSRIDMEDNVPESSRWLRYLADSRSLFSFTNLGHQQYLVNKSHIEELENKSFDCIRLGSLRSTLSMAEPFLRDADLVSFDMSAIRQSDAPGTSFPSPNGFMAEEACQLSFYAGLGDKTMCFGIYEVEPMIDINGQTAHLAAQAIWYFIEGFGQRKSEIPDQKNPDFKVFLVKHQDMEHELTFYKSLITGRWWMDVPEIRSGQMTRVACSQDEYQQACNHEIPERWWKVFQRIN